MSNNKNIYDMSVYDGVDYLWEKIINGQGVTGEDVQWLLSFPKDYVDEVFKNKDLKQENQRYKQVLEFYADERIYVMQGFERARITADHGYKAREALVGDHS